MCELQSEPSFLLKKLNTAVIEAYALRRQIVGSDNRRVSTRAPGANVAFFQNRDIMDPMVAGQVIGTGEAMPPASDDDDVIMGLEPIRSTLL